MTDDIVKRLRTVQTFTADNCEELCLITDEAAAEIERLRVAGDAMATNYELLLEDRWSAFSAAFLSKWKEARRG